MTELPASFAVDPLPVDLLPSILRGDFADLAQARITRVHFPRNRPVQIHFSDGTAAWIAEWVGQDAEARASMEAERLAALGQPALVRAASGSGLMTRALGADTKLPGLRLLHDPDFATLTLTTLGLGAPFRIDLAAHRLGKRAVLRIRHAGGTAYARLRPPGATQARLAADRHRRLWDMLRSDARLTLPEPLGEDAALGLSLYRAVQGGPPRFRGLRGFVEAEAIARALRALQDCDLDLPDHSVGDEIATLRNWQTRLDTAAALRFGPRIDRLEQDLHGLPPCRSVTCHRDLHEGQVLVRAGRAAIMDFDTLRRGDPALDLGNFQAHLILAGLREGRSLAAFVTATERPFPEVPLTRIALWRQAALIRLALMLSFTSEAATIAPALMAAAE